MIQIIFFIVEVFETKVLSFLMDGVLYIWSIEWIEHVRDFISLASVSIEYVIIVVIITVLKSIQFPYLLTGWRHCCILLIVVHAVWFVMSVWFLWRVDLWIHFWLSRIIPLPYRQVTQPIHRRLLSNIWFPCWHNWWSQIRHHLLNFLNTLTINLFKTWSNNFTFFCFLQLLFHHSLIGFKFLFSWWFDL